MSLCGYLKADTTVTISLGPFLDDDDALTEKTGLTIADTTVFLSKNGGAKANPNDTNDCTEDANGVYLKQINTTDTNTEGILTVYVHETDALYVRQDYMVVNANVYDSLFAAATTDYLQVDLLQILGTVVAESTGANIATNFNTFFDDGDDATSTAIMSYIEELAAANLPTDVAAIPTTAMRGTDSAALAASYTATRAGYLDELAAANIPADIDTIKGYLDTEIAAIKAVTDDMKVLDTTIASVTTPDTVFTLTAGLTGNDDMNNAAVGIYDTTGGIWSGPRRASDYVHASKTLTIDANTAFPLAAGDRVVIWNVSYATTAAAGSVTAGDIANITDAVWDETGSDHNTAGTTGAKQERSDRTDR